MAYQNSYALPPELARSLATIAREADLAPEALLVQIVQEYVQLHAACKPKEGERRAFKRVTVSIPAMVCVEEADESSVRYQPGMVRDVSPVGLRIVCAGGKLCGRLASDYGSDKLFEVIFSLKEDVDPIRLHCKAVRMEVVGKDLHIGARILETDSEGQRLYQQVLGMDEARS